MKSKIENSQSTLQNNVVNLIIIRAKLRKTQCLGFNQWKCNINGEERIVPKQWVELHCMSIKDPVNLFKQHEVEEITIRYQFL